MSTKAEKAMTDAAVIIAALVVAIAGFITLVNHLPSASAAETTAVVGTATAPAGVTVSDTKTTTTTAASTLAEQSISPAVIRTLALQGSAWFLPTDQATQLLPDSIVRVLEARGVVLQVQLGSG